MKNTRFYTTVESMKSENELIPNSVKVQVLNTIRNKIHDLQRKTLDKVLLGALSTMDVVVEDAYRISLYRFQFSLLTNILNKEIKNIEETILYASEADNDN